MLLVACLLLATHMVRCSPVALQMSFVCNSRFENMCSSVFSYVHNASSVLDVHADFLPVEANAKLGSNVLEPGGKYAGLTIFWECNVSPVLEVTLLPTAESRRVLFTTTRLEVPCSEQF